MCEPTFSPCGFGLPPVSVVTSITSVADCRHSKSAIGRIARSLPTITAANIEVDLIEYSIELPMIVGGILMIPQRLSLVTIGAWDVPALRSFYKRLGWNETDWSSDSYAVFVNAGCMFSIWSIDELSKDAETTIPKDPGFFRGVMLAVNVDTREQVDEVLSEAKSVGARISRPAIDRFWGGRSGCFLDPENNAWEVAFNPNSRFDERGAMIGMNG